MLKKLIFTLPVISSILLSPISSAKPKSYIGVSGLMSSADAKELDRVGIDFDSSFGIEFLYGINFPVENPKIVAGVETGLAYVGTFTDTPKISGQRVDVQLSVLSGFVSGKFGYAPVDGLEVYGKVGFNNLVSAAEATASNGGYASENTSEYRLLYGAGVGFDVSKKIQLKTNYTVYAKGLSSISLGINYRL